MKEVKDPDPFSELIRYCEPVAGDIEELRDCPFAEAGNFPESPAPSSPSFTMTPSPPTGILMLSLPSSGSVDQSTPRDNEEFETPPEHHNSSQPYFSGSDDLRPNTSAAVDGDTGSVNYDNTVARTAVEFGEDSDDVGFSVDVGKTRVSEENLDDMKVSIAEIGEKEPPVVIEIDQTQNVDTEMVDLESNGNIEIDDGKVEENLDLEDGDGGEVWENGEKGVNDKCNGDGDGEMHEIDSNGMTENVGADAGGSVVGRRKLPSSIRGGDKNVNVGWVEEAGRKALKTGDFRELLEILSMVVGKVKGGDSSNNDDDDFFEIAKARGMTFPRPRWWPPEGFPE